MPTFTVDVIPCLADNYAYLVTCTATGATALVDAPEAGPILARLERPGARLDAIWLTHHHHDHVGAVPALLAASPGTPVFAHASDRARLPALTHPLEDGATFTLGALSVAVLHVPGHTLGAVAYHVHAADGGAVFTGDTLFLAGCGRLFEGTPAMMYGSLQRLAALAPTTQIYCGHEYTAANLRFAAHLEPKNFAIAERQRAVTALRAAGQPTVPAPLSDELATNPFLRTASPELRAKVGLEGLDHLDEAVFAAARKLKDSFRG